MYCSPISRSSGIQVFIGSKAAYTLFRIYRFLLCPFFLLCALCEEECYHFHYAFDPETTRLHSVKLGSECVCVCVGGGGGDVPSFNQSSSFIWHIVAYNLPKDTSQTYTQLQTHTHRHTHIIVTGMSLKAPSITQALP